MDEVETRELRYFIAVAEELHFGRAAARLAIAQPALSKTVQRLESRLKVQLLTRNSRSVALTPAGSVLLDQGRHVLNAMSIAVQHTQQAGQTRPLRLVLKPGGDANLLSGILAAYAEQPDAHRVDILFSGSSDRSDHLHRGSADVGLLYAPFDDLAGLAAETLYVEDRVAVLPESHRLAAHEAIGLDDLVAETFPRWIGVSPESTDLPQAGTGGVRAPGPEIADVAELIPLVRIGRVVAVLPRSLITPTPPGVACVPVTGTAPSRIVIARRQNDHRGAVIALMQAAVSSLRTEGQASGLRRS